MDALRVAHVVVHVVHHKLHVHEGDRSVAARALYKHGGIGHLRRSAVAVALVVGGGTVHLGRHLGRGGAAVGGEEVVEEFLGSGGDVAAHVELSGVHIGKDGLVTLVNLDFIDGGLTLIYGEGVLESEYLVSSREVSGGDVVSLRNQPDGRTPLVQVLKHRFGKCCHDYSVLKFALIVVSKLIILAV